MSRRWAKLSRTTKAARTRPSVGQDGWISAPAVAGCSCVSATSRHRRCACDGCRISSGPCKLDAEIEPRRGEAHRLEIVDEVHAADEGDARVDHRQLAVQPPQAQRVGTPAADQRTVGQHAHARRLQRIQPVGRQLARADAVDQQAHLHAALRGADRASRTGRRWGRR
jgi:hypothetical protein